MATQIKYRADFAGDWGTPAAVAGGAYGTDTHTLPDGVKLFYRYWLAADPQAPTLVLLHGLGAHSGWFIDMGNELNARGLTIFVPDHRGFGRSEGPRGHALRWQTYPHDTESLLDAFQARRPGAPLFVLGHSMGGLFAIHVAAADARTGRNRLAGVILMNPWIRDTTKLSLATQLGIALGGRRGSNRVVVYPYNITNMTPNPEAGQLLDADSLWVKSQTASFLYQVGLLMRNVVYKRAREVRAPALVLQGEADKVLVRKATRLAFDQLGSKDKTYKTYPGFCHDCEFEPDRAAFDDDIAVWIMAHARPASA
jgi:alpha-beta hydrolase superfamily lysophospholipase